MPCAQAGELSRREGPFILSLMYLAGDIVARRDNRSRKNVTDGNVFRFIRA
jgi:hypothetical protein